MKIIVKVLVCFFFLLININCFPKQFKNSSINQLSDSIENIFNNCFLEKITYSNPTLVCINNSPVLVKYILIDSREIVNFFNQNNKKINKALFKLIKKNKYCFFCHIMLLYVNNMDASKISHIKSAEDINTWNYLYCENTIRKWEVLFKKNYSIRNDFNYDCLLNKIDSIFSK